MTILSPSRERLLSLLLTTAFFYAASAASAAVPADVPEPTAGVARAGAEVVVRPAPQASVAQADAPEPTEPPTTPTEPAPATDPAAATTPAPGTTPSDRSTVVLPGSLVLIDELLPTSSQAVRLHSVRKSLALARRGQIRLKVEAAGAARLRIWAIAGGSTLARTSLEPPRVGGTLVTLRLGIAARRALPVRGSRAVTLRLAAYDAAGRRTVLAQRAFTLR